MHSNEIIMEKPPLGRLERVDLGSYWTENGEDFTSWLSREENIALLGETIGLGLDVLDREDSPDGLGPYVLCQNSTTRSIVLIKNQLGDTDHTHLGQIVTCAAGLNATNAVWVVERFTEEHRAALDWLNSIGLDEFRLWGLEIELWRIGDSPAAPKFNLVAKPNEWSRFAKEMACGHRGHFTYNWTTFDVGRAGCSLIAHVNRRDRSAVVSLELNNRVVPGWFDKLLANRDEIEAEIGFALSWKREDDPHHSSIFTELTANAKDNLTWALLHAWVREKLDQFAKVFRPIIKTME